MTHILKLPPVWPKVTSAGGVWESEFVENAEYTITLCRFPRERGLAINATFPAQEDGIELDQTAPASVKNDFDEANRVHPAYYVYIEKL